MGCCGWFIGYVFGGCRRFDEDASIVIVCCSFIRLAMLQKWDCARSRVGAVHILYRLSLPRRVGWGGVCRQDYILILYFLDFGFTLFVLGHCGQKNNHLIIAWTKKTIQKLFGSTP